MRISTYILLIYIQLITLHQAQASLTFVSWNIRDFVFYGNDWNPNLSNPCNSGGYFESDTNFSEFDGMQFFQNNSEGYTTATVTLYAVQGGNASTSAIDESTFFKK